MRILVVEDEGLLAKGLVELLTADAYAVDLARDGTEAAELADVNSYDLILLDWGIPPPSGLELVSRWRAAGRTTPVLMLTGRSGPQDVVGGLDSGADDYLAKPFSPEVLLARVRSLLRRRHRPLQAPLVAGDLVMDRAAHAVQVDGRAVGLTPKEFAVLEYFLLHQDEVVTRAQLTEHVWDDAFDPGSNVVDVTVCRLRGKIDEHSRGKLLHTVKGVGYLLRSERGDLE